MKTLILLLLASAGYASAANNHPVVLVHGFLGFDQLPAAGFRYWGGSGDIAAYMRQGGAHQVFTAAVGPVSSNWDRAVELYYQLKGGCADYGEQHTASHARFGAIRQPARKCWEGLYPQWDADHPLHLVGHSQGGQTIRLLAHLLEQGAPGEGQGSLFAGGKRGWISSVTTISTPHNGTPLREGVLSFVPIAPQIAGAVAGAVGYGGLEHYGIPKNGSAPFWSLDNRDAAQWDLGPDGAAALNGWVASSPDIYYFSVANQSAAGPSRVFGAQANDTVVPTGSMRAPTGAAWRTYDGRAERGSWNYLGNFEGFDHFDVIGWRQPPERYYPIYDQIARIIFGL